MRLRVICLVFLALSIGFVGVCAPAAAHATQQGPSLTLGQPEGLDADDVRMDVAVRPDGSANWTVEFWVRLDDEESREAFDSLRTDVENDSAAFLEPFTGRIDETVAAAIEATGREMHADDFTVEVERQSLAREYGVLRYTFRWHGFAVVDGAELRAGDAIEGFYLEEGTRLAVSWPSAYDLTSVEPDPDDQRDGVVVWRGGETEFVTGEPQIVASSTGHSSQWPLLAGVVVGVIGLGGLAIWWHRSKSAAGDVSPDAEERDRYSAREPPASESDESLLSNEERVVALLEANGGRIKQQRVVEELEWSDAKTSKVVRSLREAGTVESFRIGRENVLTLSEDDTTESTGDS